MGDHSNLTARRPRADAVRNRELVLEAAKSVFSAGGPDASLEAVARRAGVGIGTLYRHFPTREALFEAVYRREVEHLADLAEQLKADEVAPTEALRRWLRSNVEFVATKKGMSAALALAVNKSSELSAYSFARLTEAVGALLDRAVAAGEIRADISPEDVLRALVGMCYMHDQPGWQASVLRLVEVFVDGLCRPSAGRAADAEVGCDASLRRRETHRRGGERGASVGSGQFEFPLLAGRGVSDFLILISGEPNRTFVVTVARLRPNGRVVQNRRSERCATIFDALRAKKPTEPTNVVPRASAPPARVVSAAAGFVGGRLAKRSSRS